MQKELLLSPQQITPIIKRMALEIVEHNLEEQEIIIAGIKERGIDIAKLLMTEIRTFSKLKLSFVSIDINKNNPLEINIDGIAQCKNKTIIIVDDVANTGKTLLYAMKPFLNVLVNKIEVAVLIDREHKQFPVTSTYVGYQVSTTVKEKISVEVNENEVKAMIF